MAPGVSRTEGPPPDGVASALCFLQHQVQREAVPPSFLQRAKRSWLWSPPSSPWPLSCACPGLRGALQVSLHVKGRDGEPAWASVAEAPHSPFGLRSRSHSSLDHVALRSQGRRYATWSHPAPRKCGPETLLPELPAASPGESRMSLPGRCRPPRMSRGPLEEEFAHFCRVRWPV